MRKSVSVSPAPTFIACLLNIFNLPQSLCLVEYKSMSVVKSDHMYSKETPGL